MGKTTLAKLATDRPVFHVIREGEDIHEGAVTIVGGYEPETPARIIASVQAFPAFVIEGVQVSRALRGPRVGSVRLPGLRVDAVVYLKAFKVPLGELRDGHGTQTVGTDTIFQQWKAAQPGIPIFEETAR